MKYIKYTVITPKGKQVELARSYHNSVKVIPELPFTQVLKDNSEVKAVSAAWCTRAERNKVWRRRDHMGYEALVDRLEDLWMRK